MKTYQLESVIKDNGIIELPEGMKKLERHRVKLIVIDLETFQHNPVNMLADITKKYTAINENDIDILELYEQRVQSHDRGVMFD